MANYHFHFQQYEKGHREDVRPSPAPLVSPYAAASFYEPGLLHRTVRPSQAPHIAQSLQHTAVAAPLPRPRRRGEWLVILLCDATDVCLEPLLLT